MEKVINIGGRLHNPVVGGAVTGADEIKDDLKGKMQSVINQETDAALVQIDEGKQDKLTFDQTPTEGSTNPVTSGGVYTADAALQQAIEAILLLIPSAASALNQLADKSFVNSSIATATATFRGTYNLVTDLELTVSATHQQIATALVSVISTADNNDYCFVQIPVSDQSTDIRVTERYKFDGTSWEYEYDLNNSGFTADQWGAINSGITSVLVGKLGGLPTAHELATMFAGKQNTLTFDTTPTSGSNNPVTSGGLYAKFATIDAMIPMGADANNKLVAENRLAAYVTTLINALDATFDVTSADGHVTLRMTQTDGVITSVQILTSDIASEAALTLLGGRVSTNEQDIADLQQLYNNLQQSAPQVIEPTDTWPVANPSQTVIYRVLDRVNTPPQYYSDYMWNGTSFVLMATYNNAIDDEPTAGSNNLAKSGGIEKKYRKTNSIITGDGKILFVDVNGYIGAIFDSNGLCINDVLIGKNSVKELSQSIRTEADGYLFVTDENGYIVVRIDKEGNILSNDTRHEESEYAGKLELPSKINILQGTIESLYYEQMLGNGFLRDYVLLGQSLPWLPQTDRMFINTDAVGLIVRSINLFNGFGERIEQKDININIVDKTVSGSVKICVIGDSMTENPKKLFELANLTSKDNNFDITFLGARTATGTDSEGNTRTVKHCGYSGTTIIDVCRLENYGAGLPNIFYDSNLQTTNKFSIAKGIEAMGDIPDVIIIDHGANQSGSAWSDVKGCYDFIIGDIATYNIAHNTDIKIVICVQQPGGLSQVVANYMTPSKWSRNWSPTKLMDYVEEYDNRENEGIFLLPQYLIIDPYKDYPRADVPYSSRNTSLREVALDNVHMGINMNGYDSEHVYGFGDICTDGNDNGYVSLKNNNTQPLSDDKISWAKTKDDVNAGYWKLADAYFAELKYIVSL